jgi:hypothetical protein
VETSTGILKQAELGTLIADLCQLIWEQSYYRYKKRNRRHLLQLHWIGRVRHVTQTPDAT